MLVPALAIAGGVALFLSAHLELRHVREDARRSFETQVTTLTRLVGDGARQALHALELTYSLAEEELAHAGSHLCGAGTPGPRPAWLRVTVCDLEQGARPADWGPVPAARRPALLAELRAAEEEELSEGPIARSLGLYCLRHAAGIAAHVFCGDAAELARRRREAGLGRLLRNLATPELVYVVLQDLGGVLARTAGPELSRFGDDAFLKQASKAGQTLFRDAEVAGRPLLEGVTPLALPDGTHALLRVGVDAAGLRRMEDRIASRERAHLLLISLLVGVSLVTAVILQGRRRQQLAVERLRREREEAQRQWESIGQMAATVAHEVRTPLSTISMATQRLRREFSVAESEREEFGELMALVASETERLDRVVKDFIDLGRPLSLRRELVRVDAAVRATLTPLAFRAESAGKRLVVEACSEEAELDPQRFSQLLTNLVGNALDAVGSGGQVVVAARAAGGRLELTVSDDGPGMDAETLLRAQLPFVTTKAHGTGLGLPLAHRLAEAHAGTLALRSAPGTGTRATVSLPLRSVKT